MIFQGTFPEVFALLLVVTAKEKDEITLQLRIVIIVFHHHNGQFIPMEVNPSDFRPSRRRRSSQRVVIVAVHSPDEETNFHVVLEDENASRG